MLISELKKEANSIRKMILEMIYRSKSSHIGSAFSIVDILTVLYFEIMNIDPKNPSKKDRDRFILSKGHACTALYATLAQRGFFNKELLQSYGFNGTKLAGHISLGAVSGIEATAGSLGHGLPIACGMALSLKLDHKNGRVFVLLGDGECNEGSVWEAALAAAHFRLDNLIVIIDKNRQQGMGNTKTIINMDPFLEKWKSFGWNTHEINGHDIKTLVDNLKLSSSKRGNPNVFIANTIKGKGVAMMQDKIEWHYRAPKDDEYKVALAELNCL